MVLACGGCDPFLLLAEDPEDDLVAANKNNDAGTSVLSNMEVLATESMMDRNKTRSPGLESIPEALTERSDTEEREAGEEGLSETSKIAELNSDERVVTVDGNPANNIDQEKVHQNDAGEAPTPEKLRAPSPPPKITLSSRVTQTNEQDYNKDPTELYLTLQRKDWQQAIELLGNDAQQAATWVSRKESGGGLLWRLLPIHAAIIFSAPESVVEAVLKAFPEGAQHKEDQGMLPLHLAFRMGAAENVVSLLLNAFPDSVNVTDRKGRTALELAESSSGPNKSAFLRALRKGPNVDMFGVSFKPIGIQLVEMQEEYERKIEQLRKEADDKQSSQHQEILTLQKALVRKQETSQALVDHIASLEAKLAELTDPNRRGLDINLEILLSNGLGADEIERMYKDEFAILEARNRYLESKAAETKHDKEKATDALKQTLKIFETRKAEWNAEKKLYQDKLIVVEEDCNRLKDHVSTLEEQIKKRSISEKALAAQISVLAEQLSATTSDSSSSTEAFSTRIRVLEAERENLRFSVNKLTKKLYFVASLIDSVSKDQIAIVEHALLNESKASVSASTQEKMMMEVKEHSELVQDAKNLGDEIKELLMKHAQQMEKTYEARKSVVEVIEEQSRQLTSAEERREELIKGMNGFKNQMLEVLDSVYDELPKEVPEEHNLVDMVLEKMISFKEDELHVPEDGGIIVEEEKKCEE